MGDPGPNEEQGFKQMWVEARFRFEETTKKSLVQSRNHTLDDVLKDLDQKFNGNDTNEGAKQQRVKELASNVLTFIKLLGGIAAQGASMVFGPANLCFNALSFLIDIPAKISKFYDDLAQLFEEISTFMKQFKIYQRIEQYAKVDIELKQGTHKLMIVFVDICAISIDVLSGSKLRKLKTMAKIALFDNDSGIHAKLEEFRRLIDHQSRISDAVTLEHVLKSEHEMTNSMNMVFEMLSKASEDSRKQLDLRSQEIQNELKQTHEDVKSVKAGTEVLVKDVNDRTVANKLNEQMSKLCKKLAIASETVQDPEKDFEQIRENGLPGTGAWLRDIEEYKRWADLGSDAYPVLLLSGSNGTGKSNLVSALLQDLRIQYRTLSSSSIRVSLACYGFGKSEKSSRDGASRNPHPSTMALKSMAAQIAKQNSVYAKNLSSYLDLKDPSFSRDMNAKDLSQELLPPPNMKDTSDMAYVLILDGLDQLSHGEANQLFDAFLAIASPQLRIIITATDEIFRDCLDSSGQDHDVIPTIRISEHNESDIKQYIESELKASTSLQGDAAGIVRIVNSIREKLSDIAKGNFNNARQVIESVTEAVESLQTEEDIEKLISSDSLKNKDQAVERLVKDLNESLNDQEIEQLNELLVWALYGSEWFSIEQMRAALFLRTKAPPLQKLEKQIRDKYSKIFDFNSEEGNIVSVRSSDLEEYFQGSKRVKRRAQADIDDDPTISMTISIKNLKLSKVQRFFWDLSEKVVLDKFEFTNSLNDLAPTATISANRSEAHLTLARRCFELLVNDVNENTKALVQYAARYLPIHLAFLREAIDEGEIELAEKEEITSNLVYLLQSIECIERHLSEGFFEWTPWLTENFGLKAIKSWLSDSESQGRLNRKELSWLKQVTAGNGMMALEEIATMMARHWLSDRSFAARLPYEWLDDYLNKAQMAGQEQQQGEKSKNDETKETDTGHESTDAAAEAAPVDETASPQTRVLRAAEWTGKKLNIATKNALWFERLGETYLWIEETRLATESFLKAKELTDFSWKVSEGLAETYASDDNKTMAVQEMEIVLTRLRADAEPSAGAQIDLVKNLLKTAKWQAELEDTDAAIQKLEEATRIDPHHYESQYELLKLFVNTNKKADASNLLSEMRSQRGKNGTLNQLESMIMEISSWDEPVENFQTIFHATKEDDMFEVVSDTLGSTLAFARDNRSTSNVIEILLGQGVALARHSARDKSLEEALKRWVECYRLGFQRRNSEKAWSALTAARFVINHHFSEAQSASDAIRDHSAHSKSMEKLIESASVSHPWAARKLRLTLARLYYQTDRQDFAQKLLLNDLKDGLDYLSDDDPENDFIGYGSIANILMHVGDDLNALSGWSLIGPPERYNNEPIDVSNGDDEEAKKSKKRMSEVFRCDGRCGVPITHADGAWFCKVCDDVQFDDVCMSRLRNGELKRFVCSPNHEWLRVPAWTDEVRDTGKDRVRVGGELVDGKRVGGKIVPVEEWLDDIRLKWGIEKPVAAA